MIKKLSTRLGDWADGRLVLALVAILVVWEAVTLPILQAAPGGDINPLDARFFYTPKTAFSVIGAYGKAAPTWMRIYFTWDVINPLLYSLMFSLGISWLFKRGFTPRSSIQRLNLVPWVAGLLDLAENTSIVVLLAMFPSEPVFLAWLATLCTMGKVIVLGLSTLLVIFGAAAAIRRSILAKEEGHGSDTGRL